MRSVLLQEGTKRGVMIGRTRPPPKDSTWRTNQLCQILAITKCYARPTENILEYPHTMFLYMTSHHSQHHNCFWHKIKIGKFIHRLKLHSKEIELRHKDKFVRKPKYQGRILCTKMFFLWIFSLWVYKKENGLILFLETAAIERLPFSCSLFFTLHMEEGPNTL